MVRLLVLITTQVEKVDSMFSEMLEKGLCGATAIDGKGMLESLNESQIDPPPIFGSLRQFIHPDRENAKVILIAVSGETLPQVKRVIYRHIGDLSQPDTGILFVLPIEEVEGLHCGA